VFRYPGFAISNCNVIRYFKRPVNYTMRAPRPSKFHPSIQESLGRQKGKGVWSEYEPSGPSGACISGFCSMKRQGVFLLPLDGMLEHRRVTPAFRPYPFIHLGGERHCESKVSSPKTQHNVHGQGSNPNSDFDS